MNTYVLSFLMLGIFGLAMTGIVSAYRMADAGLGLTGIAARALIVWLGYIFHEIWSVDTQRR